MNKDRKRLNGDLTHEFLELLYERAAERCGGKVERAFIEWYVEAEFGEVKWHYTDGPSDGGIDAVIWTEDEYRPVVILQSKFTKNVGRHKLGTQAYIEFGRVVDLFHRRDDAAFEEWLYTCDETKRKFYRDAYKQIGQVDHWAHGRKAFRLITCACRHQKLEHPRLSAAPAYSYCENILDLYRHNRVTGMPKPRPLSLSVRDLLRCQTHPHSTRSALFITPVTDFRTYLQKVDVARLVSRNIRFNLGKRIGRSIRATYEDHPEDFWYLHNGLSIVCDRLVRQNGRMTLHNPSVINGAQTLYAISGSAKHNPSARVTVRVIERAHNGVHHDDDAWLQDVIRGVNTQNKVQSVDFFSNEPEQFELQQLFHGLRVFYERKRGEWNNHRNNPTYASFRRFSFRTLAQLMLTASEIDGSGVLEVKRGLEKAFQDRQRYDHLFGSRQRMRLRFKRVYLLYRLYGLIREHGYKDRRTFRKQRHGFWHAFWIASRLMLGHKELLSRCTVGSIREAFDAFAARGQKGVHARKVVKDLTKQVWRAYRSGRRRDPEHWTANNFFKERYGCVVVRRLVAPKMRAPFGEIAGLLERN